MPNRPAQQGFLSDLSLPQPQTIRQRRPLAAAALHLAPLTLRRALLRRLSSFLAALALAASAAGQGTVLDPAWALLQDSRRATVVLMRHAQAPGSGDPPGFQLGDCSTQRNLDDAGRAQARRIGEAFRSRGVKVSAVRHSMWCRTRETAELAFPGLARADGHFNSFFEDHAREPAQTAAALATLLKWRGPGVMVVVTHQVNITALTGVVPASGEGVVLRAKGKELELLGRITP
jgi:phosphohistidine phosphatase SixA